MSERSNRLVLKTDSAHPSKLNKIQRNPLPASGLDRSSVSPDFLGFTQFDPAVVTK
jgi:hypothetical protein